MSERFSITTRIYYEDTDAGGVVYYSNYLKFLERCRTEWLRSLGYNQVDLLQDPGVAFVVRNVNLDYLKPAKLDDLIRIDMGIEKITRSQIFFDQHICREPQGEELVVGKIQIICVNIAQMKIVSIPPLLRAALEK